MASVTAWLLVTATPPAAAPSLHIVYLGRAKNTGMAVFSVSNSCPMKIVRSAAYRVQRPAGDGWTSSFQALVPAGGMLLRPGDQENISVPVPTGMKTWRLELDVWPHSSPGPGGWLLEHGRAALRNVGVPANGDVHISRSPAITE